MPWSVIADRSGAKADLDVRARALKERIYAIFTGLAILTAVSAMEHAEPDDAFWSVGLGILAISVAGFVAEVVPHLVTHGGLPHADEVRVMARIALGALGSAAAPLVLLLLAWSGQLTLGSALNLGVLLYNAILIAIMVLATRRTTLRLGQRALAVLMLLVVAEVVVLLLFLAHKH